MKTKTLLLLAVLAFASLTGCNTVRGFGEDVSALGRSLSNATGTSAGTH